MATIHLARLLGPQGFSRTVAIKQLHPQFAQNPQFVAMLLDEARLAVRVRHVNVVSPLDIVATESELFIVMDYVNGESLANLLVASDAALRPPFAAAILVQALLGLHAAHEATREQGDALGLVHRDVSPQNILVGQDGVARMLDFGIAKAVARTQTTDGGMVKGKLGYMAPEQIRLQAVDRRTDLFSAGVVLWEALTGTGLFVADALGASIESILHAEIAPPSRFNAAVTPELDAVVLKALERDRDRRFSDALSMAAALQRATPLASALEVMHWVEALAGAELERRAELVKRAESMSWEGEDPVEPAPSTSLAARAASERNPRAGAVDAAGPPRRTPTLLGIHTPREASPRDGFDILVRSGAVAVAGGSAPLTGGLVSSGLLATGESTGVAVGGDRFAASAVEGKSRPPWRTIGIALGLALAALTVGFGALALRAARREGSFISARQPLGAEPVALEVDARSPRGARAAPAPLPPIEPQSAEPQFAEPQSTEPRSAEPRPAEPRPAEPQSDEPRASAAGAPPALASRVDRAEQSEASSARASSSSRRSAARKKAEAKPNAKAVTSSQRKSPRAAAAACNPPWVVNDEQVKVFKAECLR